MMVILISLYLMLIHVYDIKPGLIYMNIISFSFLSYESFNQIYNIKKYWLFLYYTIGNGGGHYG